MHKDKLISFTLIMIVIFKLIDLSTDISSNIEPKHIWQEITLIALSLALFVYLVIDIHKRTINEKLNLAQLKVSKENIRLLNQQLEDSKVAFFNEIEGQFQKWGLTAAEKEIALFLVKGLSTSEIASIRNKSEKTISNQSSAIYKKADVTGRHELAALFFEMLL
ncbi:MAG: DNA-binding CsgD family transcriptional regulator [Pseudoalteromonas rhizosphaerae]|jgi:DNA-binding CsgD family transcriptional regulator|uniref:Response regulator transcription factor n=2 Tax=Pseudoalteromonas TaxID=53246 RepID=A0ABY3FAE3_9GAMM|nr:response regulator transcription factor [Pseudoalteromonas sp. SR41-4]MBB1301423.1 response regulator transcription factor [Pseudoalteromonas sp. SR44-8]MBB1311442.1 response regulator transcription factor [Pseudoalteromonas sp. SR41-8]MBB1397170.1 response regulator transcription factor [Pseudoalteromonas sp. SG44-8]MBB1408259.1 response regulator transcription factor [Pseudoalteromonas sp. SG44-17]MBB1505523.1 response regulator transcription factor [Pseudoalteromonas sp. SG41-1]TVU80860